MAILKIKSSVKVEKPQNGDIKLDLHGLRADEAIENLDKFLSDALLAGFEEVLVYHGIGTGKLAFAVKEFLKKHGARDTTGRESGFEELTCMKPHMSHHMPGEEIPEKSRLYRFAKKNWFFGFGAYG